MKTPTTPARNQGFWKTTGLLSLFLILGASAATFEYSPDGELKSASYGPATIRVYAHDNSGNLTQADGPSLLDTWRKQTFGTYVASGTAGNLATHNAVANLTRFALGLGLDSPMESRFQHATTAAGTELTYWAHSDMSGLTVILDSSTDLKTWSPLAGKQLIATEPGYQQWKITIPATAGNLFFRIQTNLN